MDVSKGSRLRPQLIRMTWRTIAAGTVDDVVDGYTVALAVS
jgi:hypothetical protein